MDLKTIAEAIHDLRPSTSCGVDGLTSRLLKQAGPSIFKPLLHIINLSIEHGIFPDAWKIGCITPLFKESDASNPSNYRPISIFPCLGKVCERIIHTQLYGYFTEQNLLTEDQSGFRKGHSTGSCLVDFLGNIYTNIDKGNLCGVLFLDLKKAFDMVDHSILTSKLRNYGIKSGTVKWITSYLCGRLQVTKVGWEISCPSTVDCGIPQGSILGPLSFTIYVNDLPKAVTSSKINLYADDTALTVISKNANELEENLNKTLSEVSIWFKANKLSLNITKSKVMCFGTNPQLTKLSNITVQHDNVILEKVSHYKYLGVTLDSRLSYSHHIGYIESKVIKRIGVLGRARHFLSEDTCIYLYKQLIITLMDYCDHIYAGTTQKCKVTLQKLQNSAARCILYADKMTPSVVLN